MKTGILARFLTLAEKVSVFHHWVGCLLWVFHTGLWRGSFLPLLVCSEFLSWKGVGDSASIEMIMWFWPFILLMYVLHWLIFLCRTILVFPDKSHLVTVYNPYDMLLSILHRCSQRVLVCSILVVFFVWLWYQGDASFLEWWYLVWHLSFKIY